MEEDRKRFKLIELRTFMNRNRFFIPFIIVCSALIIIFSISLVINDNIYKSVSNKNGIALQEYNSVNEKMQNENMKSFEKTLKSSFSAQQLIKISQNETLYSLTVNGTNVTDSSTIYLKSPSATILLSENYGKTTLNLLPRSIIEMGSIMKEKDAFNLLSISPKKEKVKTKLYDFYYGKTISYTIDNIKVGDIITIELEPTLAKKIGFESEYIEIFYNKAG